MNYTADQLATIIKMACKKDIIELGEDDDQDFYIFQWINMFLNQNARKAYVTRFSDNITISATGFVEFQQNSQPIADMLEPLMMFDRGKGDQQFPRRQSYDSSNPGWFRMDAYSPIHVKGANGTYTLNYLKYPDKITLGTQIPEYPPMGYGEMISWVVSRIKYSKNYYEESKAIGADAQAVSLAAAKASIAARGSNQAPPSENDAKMGG